MTRASVAAAAWVAAAGLAAAQEPPGRGEALEAARKYLAALRLPADDGKEGKDGKPPKWVRLMGRSWVPFYEARTYGVLPPPKRPEAKPKGLRYLAKYYETRAGDLAGLPGDVTAAVPYAEFKSRFADAAVGQYLIESGVIADDGFVAVVSGKGDDGRDLDRLYLLLRKGEAPVAKDKKETRTEYRVCGIVPPDRVKP